MKNKILHEDSTEHATITEVLEEVYCQPTEGMTEAEMLARLKELGCDDDIFFVIHLQTAGFTILVKHN